MEKLFIDLTDQEQKTYLKLALNGDNDALDKIVRYNLKLVVYIANKYFSGFESEKSEIFSYGLVGLFNALSSYDIERGYEFSTYASRCIYNQMVSYLRKYKKYCNDASIDEPLKEDSSITLADTLDNGDESIEDYVEHKEMLMLIRRVVDELPECDKIIMKMYYGFINNKLYTQEEIGKKLGYSRSSVSRKIDKNLEKLKVKIIGNDKGAM